MGSFLAILATGARFIAENWRVFLFAALIGIIWFERKQIQKRDLAISEAARDIELARANLDTCRSVMTDLKARSEQQEAALKSATELANNAALSARKAALAWLNAPVPKDCEGAIRWQAVNGKQSADEWEGGK